MSSRILNVKSNEGIIYAFLGFDVCRQEIEAFENSKRTSTAAQRCPTQSYNQAKALIQCYENRATKLDPISLPIFNDVRECLFQNDSHIFNCKEQLNQLAESFRNPENYKQMLLMSTDAQKKPKMYNTTLNFGQDDLN